MTKAPRGTNPHDPKAKRKSTIFTTEFLLDNVVFGGLIGLVCLAGFIAVLFTSPEQADVPRICNAHGADADIPVCQNVFRARSTMFLILGLGLVVHGWNCRNVRKSIFRLHVWPREKGNMTLIAGLAISATLLILPVYIPYVNTRIFGMKGVGWEWGIVAAAVVIFVCGADIFKAWKRRHYGKKELHVQEMQAQP